MANNRISDWRNHSGMTKRMISRTTTVPADLAAALTPDLEIIFKNL